MQGRGREGKERKGRGGTEREGGEGRKRKARGWKGRGEEKRVGAWENCCTNPSLLPVPLISHTAE